MRARHAAIVFACALATGCLRTTQYHCAIDDNCGTGGRCEPQGYCSFFDASCAMTQQRFGDSAGAFANACVASAGLDGGVDSVVDGPRLIDAATDAQDRCPGFATLTGGNPNHKYKLVATSNTWTAQKTACAGMGQVAYLAIPDDAGELAAIAGLTTGMFWLGIDDLAQQGMYVNVKNVAQTFLPWASGQPDQNGNRFCVVAVSTTQIATSNCGPPSLLAVCECEE